MTRDRVLWPRSEATAHIPAGFYLGANQFDCQSRVSLRGQAGRGRVGNYSGASTHRALLAAIEDEARRRARRGDAARPRVVMAHPPRRADGTARDLRFHP